MEENPGAGNVLLRTLATILAQRLRRVDPEAFGLSAYAVVDSPELKEQDAADAEAKAPLPGSGIASRETINPVASAPVGSSAAGRQPAAAILQSAAPARGKSPSETQVIPDPDELEPLYARPARIKVARPGRVVTFGERLRAFPPLFLCLKPLISH